GARQPAAVAAGIVGYLPCHERNAIMETRVRNRPVWPYVLAVILLIILALLVMRNCRQDRGYDEGVPPMVPYTDTLETDTTMRSPDEGYGPYDTAGTGDRTDTADPSDRNPGDTV